MHNTAFSSAFQIKKMVVSARALFLLVVLCCVFVQTTYASVFSQLQFIKISSPKNGQDIRAGKTVLFKYVMQPLIKSIFIRTLQFLEYDQLTFFF